MQNALGKARKPECVNCGHAKICRDSAVSWILLIIAVVATITIRLVNVVMDFSQLWAKILWYIGVGGFFIFFLYKFHNDRILQRRMSELNLLDKMIGGEMLTKPDYEYLAGILCQMKSKKDSINYFFIFLTSGLALLVAIYQDFL
jgi:hypothetical protein